MLVWTATVPATAWVVPVLPKVRTDGRVVDAVVAGIGASAITRSDVEQEYRLEQLIESGRVSQSLPDAVTFAAVRDRLINQRILDGEAKQEGIDDEKAIERARTSLNELSKRSGTPENWASALSKARCSEQDLLERLRLQERIQDLIEAHLKPSVIVNPQELEAYYQNEFVPGFKRQNTQSPPLAQVSAQIQKVLEERKLNQLLERWLTELRSNDRVVIFPDPQP